MPCPKCASSDVRITTDPPFDRPVYVICNHCGFHEADHQIGSFGNCRCPGCASTDVKIRTVSAQSGNTDWVLFSCNKCGLESGLVDDQQYESSCEWYDPGKYTWITEIRENPQASIVDSPKPQIALSDRAGESASAKGLSEWYVVTFDQNKAYRNARPPGATPWADSFAWADVIRVCYEPSEDLMTSDTFYVFTKERPESYAIPLEAGGATALWGAILKRGLFDAETSIKISTGQLGFSCWPPVDA